MKKVQSSSTKSAPIAIPGKQKTHSDHSPLEFGFFSHNPVKNALWIKRVEAQKKMEESLLNSQKTSEPSAQKSNDQQERQDQSLQFKY